MSPYDYLIVGGGVIGMLTARELGKEGACVALIERGSAGKESSWAGGGILSPLHPWRYPDPVNVLARWSQDQYPSLAAELHAATGIDPQWTCSGLLITHAGDHEQAFTWAKRFDYQLAELGPAEVQDIEPQLAAVSEPALWLEQVAQIRNPRFAQAIRKDLERRKITVYEGREVTELLLDHGRACGVVTIQGELQAKAVVVAAGAWTGRLLNGLGGTVDIAPVRGQMLLFHGEPGLISRIILSGARYIIPRRDGRVLVGSTQERVGFDKSTTDVALQRLSADATALVPVLARCAIERHWAGLRPGSPNGVPYIGEHPHIRNLYINAGHFRNGLVLALASTRLLADLVLGRAPILDPSPYALHVPRQTAT